MTSDLGLGFDNSQNEELFCFLDEDNTFTITIKELESKIFDCRIDIEKALRNIRRAIVRAEFDIEEALKAKDINKLGTIPFSIWSKLLKQYEVEIKPVESEAIFRYFSKVSDNINEFEEQMEYL